jgi:lipid II:glycine glycyltransferase (peptidoglycan interpeptide bridge formation enzyme)
MASTDLLDRFCQREDLHQSFGYKKLMEKIGWSSLFVSGSYLSVRQLGPISLAKIQRPSVIDLPKLTQLRKRLLLAHLIVEPGAAITLVSLTGKKLELNLLEQADLQRCALELKKAGLRLSTEHYAHSKTMILDVQAPMEEFLKTLPQKVRYNIKQALKAEVSYTTTAFADLQSEDLDAFFSLHARWSTERKILGFSTHFLTTIFEVFVGNGYLIQARVNNELLGAMIVLIHQGVGYYYYTCTIAPGFKFQIPSGLTYHAIAISKTRGCDIFDFCSVYDERYPQVTLRWKGFSEFKSRFNPVAVYYPPTFSRWI